jgi:hypothetical protein
MGHVHGLGQTTQTIYTCTLYTLHAKQIGQNTIPPMYTVAFLVQHVYIWDRSIAVLFPTSHFRNPEEENSWTRRLLIVSVGYPMSEVLPDLKQSTHSMRRGTSICGGSGRMPSLLTGNELGMNQSTCKKAVTMALYRRACATPGLRPLH